MNKKIHPKFSAASNLIFLIVALEIVHVFLPTTAIIAGGRLIVIGTMLFYVGLGYLARRGFSWVKYILLLLTIISVINISVTLMDIGQSPVAGIIGLVQTLLHVYATVLLFAASKDKPNPN